ncbi:vWA domain-containing protein [Pseudonocardia hierapolitana]|nr:vWA domain-containing protein [Pseudonocardia hierapolitana]
MGRFKNGKFDLVVVANFSMSSSDATEWRRSFEKASELFWDASEGQVQYGRIFVCDESVGADSAEIILHASGDPSYGTWGKFGVPGQALHLMPYVKFQVLTHHHEMGHHVWALGEEYAADAVLEQIDTSVAAPDNATVPLVGSSFAPGALVDADAILKFGANLERRNIAANTTTSLTVSPAFSQSPTTDSDGRVQYQFPAECATATGSRFCIMENSRGAAGTLDAAGNWTPAAQPVTEFCSDSNHDADLDTQQEARNHDSCWETIVARPGYTGLAAPDPAVAGPTTGFSTPDWIVLDKQSRFAVMVDRSGSMSVGNKMTDARHGAVYWLEFCSVGNDLLSLISYDDQIDTLLGLTQVSALGGLGPTTTTINALTPRGSTNIRDALFAGRDQIESLPTRAAVQVALLITDGIHNFPTGSSPTEALDEYQEGGIRLYALGVGQPGAVDMGVLDGLAAGTGGRSFSVGDNQPNVIENAMIEINAEVRGGIITTEPALFPDSGNSGIDEIIEPPLEQGKGSVRPGQRPPLATLLDAAGVKSLESLLKRGRQRSDRIVVIPVDVESDADRASFSIVHPPKEDVWLYLVAPDGAVVDPNAGDVHHVESTSPHEFVVVDRPLPGRWLLVAVRVRPGAAFTAGVVAGGENRNLQVFASAPPWAPSATPVVIRGAARWKHQLSDIGVRANVTAPSGATWSTVLVDDEADRRNTGNYQAVYQPQEDGRYRALVTIVGSPTASIAEPFTRLSHSETDSIDSDPGAPFFVRQVVIGFDVGERRKPKPDDEIPSRPLPHRPRPTRLRSADWTRLYEN